MVDRERLCAVSAHGAAETVFTGGPIHLLDDAGSVVAALAIRGGRVVAHGDDALAFISDQTRVVELRGRTIFPGFQDAHVHPLDGGLQWLGCNLDGVHSELEYRRLITDFVRANPGSGSAWVVGGGWYGDVFAGGFPHRALLDELVPDRPAYFMSHDAHGAWVNSEALRRAGISATTPDPQGGIIVRDASGEPTGMLIEFAAEMVSRLLPVPSTAVLRQAMLEAQQYLHSLGVTAWQDAIVGEALGMPDSLALYRELDESGELTARVSGALWWDPKRGLEQISELVRRRFEGGRNARGVGGNFRATTIKIMLDGVCENFTAALTRP